MCEQASNTLNHINRAELFKKKTAMARLWDILKGWGQLTPLAKKFSYRYESEHSCR